MLSSKRPMPSLLETQSNLVTTFLKVKFKGYRGFFAKVQFRFLGPVALTDDRCPSINRFCKTADHNPNPVPKCYATTVKLCLTAPHSLTGNSVATGTRPISGTSNSPRSTRIFSELTEGSAS